MAEAASAGQQRLWDLAVESGAIRKDRVRKKWLVTWDERLEPTCESLADEEVGIDENFSIGRQGPPAHPDCRCATGLVRADASEREMPPAHDVLKAAVEEGFAGLRASLAVVAAVASRPIQITVPERAITLTAPDIHVTVPERETHVHVAAPDQSPVTVQPADVHVAAPIVTVQAAPAPQVTLTPQINVHVPKPERRPRKIEYDAEGRVSRIIEE